MVINFNLLLPFLQDNFYSYSFKRNHNQQKQLTCLEASEQSKHFTQQQLNKLQIFL